MNHHGATYVVRLDGAVDDDGTVPLSVGENVISVVVTAEDGETNRTYSVTVTRAAPDATASIALAPSDTMIEGEGTEIAVTLSFGNLTFDDDRATTDYTFRADVKDSEDGDADGCEGHDLGKDRYMYQVDEDPETRNATISADCPAGVYTLPGQYLQRRQRGTGLGHRRVFRPPAARRIRGGGGRTAGGRGAGLGASSTQAMCTLWSPMPAPA